MSDIKTWNPEDNHFWESQGKKIANRMMEIFPKSEALRFPVEYLANLLTAGAEAPIISALNRMLAMRSNQRTIALEGHTNKEVLDQVGLTEEQAEEMYQMLGIANYEDRFVIPTSHEELRHEDPYAFQGQNGFDASGSGFTLFPSSRKKTVIPISIVPPK